ncbi:MAG: hypothetical protein GY757_31110 [bacterium]|nr:hypothetical protein [bacterium]
MKKTLVTLFLIVTLFVATAYSKKETILEMPVKVSFTGMTVQDLTKDDLKLLVNGTQTEIAAFTKSENSQVRTQYILCFNTTDYLKQITDGITYFVSNMLNHGDALIIWTPAKMYNINTNRDKKVIFTEIEEKVKKDILAFRTKLKIPTNNLNAVIKKYHRGKQGGRRSESGKTDQSISDFLNNYAREFSAFQNIYILPNLFKIQSVAELLKGPGEKRIINFQERDFIPTIGDYQKVAREIREIASELGNDQATYSMFYTGLKTIDQLMMLSEKVPIKEITAILNAQKVNYNTVLFMNQRKNSNQVDAVSPDFESIFKTISNKSGGTTASNSDLAAALSDIHKDSSAYYTLSYKFNGKFDNKILQIYPSIENVQLFFKNKYNPKEIKALVDFMNAPKVKLSKFSLKKRILKFSISNFQLGAPDNKEQGIIQVRIELLDSNNNIAWKTQNTLKSQKKSIDISIPMPANLKGKYTVKLSAFDLVSKKNTQLIKDGKL